jgi:hypothetical protein
MLSSLGSKRGSRRLAAVRFSGAERTLDRRHFATTVTTAVTESPVLW